MFDKNLSHEWEAKMLAQTTHAALQRAAGTWHSLGSTRGVIHVYAAGSGRTTYQAVLDMDRLADLRVGILEPAQSLAQVPPPAGYANQVQPAPCKKTERSSSAALALQTTKEIAATRSPLKVRRWQR